jgi:hypothetical protein
MMDWKDDKRSDTGLIWGTVPEFVLRDEGILRKLTVR